MLHDIILGHPNCAPRYDKISKIQNLFSVSIPFPISEKGAPDNGAWILDALRAIFQIPCESL